MSKEITTLSNDEQQATIEATQVLASKQDALMQLGQIQAFNFIGKLVTVSELKILQQVKESKNYKGLTYKGELGKLETVSTWDQCCEKILGVSRKSIDERLLNLSQFGDAFFEQAQAMRLGYRDLKALRQLSEDDQALVIESEAVETGDKEAVKELIDDLKAKHAKSQAEQTQKLKDTENQLAAARKSRDDYQTKANALEEQLELKRFQANTWQEQVKQLLLEATQYEGNAIESLSQLCALRTHFMNSDDLPPEAIEHLAAGILDSFKSMAEDFAQAWMDTANMLEGYLPSMRPSLEVLQDLADSAAQSEG